MGCCCAKEKPEEPQEENMSNMSRTISWSMDTPSTITIPDEDYYRLSPVSEEPSEQMTVTEANNNHPPKTKSCIVKIVKHGNGFRIIRVHNHHKRRKRRVGHNGVNSMDNIHGERSQIRINSTPTVSNTTASSDNALRSERLQESPGNITLPGAVGTPRRLAVAQRAYLADPASYEAVIKSGKQSNHEIDEEQDSDEGTSPTESGSTCSETTTESRMNSSADVSFDSVKESKEQKREKRIEEIRAKYSLSAVHERKKKLLLEAARSKQRDYRIKLFTSRQS